MIDSHFSRIRWAFPILLTALLGGFAQASEKKQQSTPAPFQQLWSRGMLGGVSSMAIAQEAKAILVATSPDSDIPGSKKFYTLSRYDQKGKLKWTQKAKSPVRELDVSEDGKLTVISNYGNRLIGLDPKGKTLWEVETLCRPIILDPGKQVLCYHDDDAQPKIAFELLDYQGKSIYAHPIHKDILSLKVAPDEKHWVIALEDGEVSLFDTQHQSKWTIDLEGEVIDLAMSYEKKPQVAILLRSSETDQKVVTLDSKGKITHSFPLEAPASQLAWSTSSDRVFLYGSHSKGQSVRSLELTQLNNNQKTLEYHTPLAVDYSYAIQSFQEGVLMGVEENSSKGRESQLAYIRSSNAPVKQLVPSKRHLEAYLSLFLLDPTQNYLSVAMDDGTLSLYRVK